MSCQQNQQKYQLPAKCLPKYPHKHPPKALQALAPCLPPAPSCCVPSCCISGFGSCCSLVSHRFPSVYLCQPQPSNCCEVEPSGCSSCCHSFGATADLQPWRSKRATAKEQSGADITSHSRFYSSLSS
ncbi:late cornified envelope protein 7A-like [Tursiops truncatus]|uniref:late cornified envelope protein 7A-like n=1 Tax=Tursiops truncatus TaxID=9739 RepID=UPI003CCF53EC